MEYEQHYVEIALKAVKRACRNVSLLFWMLNFFAPLYTVKIKYL